MLRRKARNRLSVLRAAIPLPQYALAAKARIAPMRYWRIEHGYVLPTPDECARLAKALHVDVAALALPEVP